MSKKKDFKFISLIVLTLILMAWSYAQPLELGLVREWEQPTWSFPFGLGENGINLFRMGFMAMIKSFITAFSVCALSLIIGLIVSAIAYFNAKKFNSILFHLLNFLEAFPALLIYCVLCVFLNDGFFSFILILTSMSWISFARYGRSFFIEHQRAEFILAAQNLGLSSQRIFLKHLLPQVSERFLILCLSCCRHVILAESLLAFLGLGTQRNGIYSLGSMLHSGQRVLFRAPHGVVAPTFFLALLLILLNIIFDRIQCLLRVPSKS
jgi:ABC-type dipeptide/oligopeptide/nickel transport system permease subunit